MPRPSPVRRHGFVHRNVAVGGDILRAPVRERLRETVIAEPAQGAPYATFAIGTLGLAPVVQEERERLRRHCSHVREKLLHFEVDLDGAARGKEVRKPRGSLLQCRPGGPPRNPAAPSSPSN